MAIKIKRSVFWDNLDVDTDSEIHGKLRKYADGVLKLLASYEDGMTAPDIKKNIEGNNSSIDASIRTLLESNKIYREGEGVKKSPYIYKLTKGGEGEF